MSFFDDLEQYFQNTAIITERPEKISYKSLLSMADSIGGQVKKRSLVFAVCRNCLESVAGYIGFMRSKAATALLSNTLDNSFFMDLVKAYKPAYIYLPKEKSELMNGFCQVYSCGDYNLFKADYDVDYVVNDELALLMATSGSTGSPKLVRQSYRNIESNTRAIARYLEITGDDRPITTMPMSYAYGLSIINSHLLKGASIVLTEATLMEKRFWEMMRNNDVTTFGGVPYIYEMLKKLRFERMGLPSLRYITQAGGKLSEQLCAEFADICAGKNIRFYVMYGQTEACARMSYLPWEYARTKIGSIGVAIPGGRFWLEDENGNIVEENDTPGELIYQGGNVALGYSHSCLDLCRADDENKGILRTGDIARRDAQGFYYIVGRKKRFLKIFGSRVNLDEVEQLVKAAGYECICCGVDDNMKIYLTNPEHKDEVENYIIQRIGINKAGFTVKYVGSIPRGDSNKVLYSALS